MKERREAMIDVQRGVIRAVMLLFVVVNVLCVMLIVNAHAETVTFGHQYYEERGGRLVPRKDKVRELEMTGYSTDMDAFCEEEPDRKFCIERGKGVLHQEN